MKHDPMAVSRRVAIVSPAASGADGDRWLLDVAQGLSARGHEITVVGPAESPFLGAAARSGLPVAMVPFLGTHRSLDARGPRGPGADPRHGHRIDLRHMISLWQTLRDCRAQVVIVDREDSLELLQAARFHLRFRVVADLAPSLPLPAVRAPRPGRHIDHLVVHSPEVLGALLARHGAGLDMARTSVIPLAVDTAAIDAIDRRSARRGLRRDLGWAETQPVAAIIADSTISSSAHTGIVAEALASLGAAAPKPVWMGETSRLSNPTRVLAGADLLVIASVHHGLPVAPLQAMALEVPVVAVAAGEHRSLLDGKEPARGLLFHSGQPQELAAALGKVLEDPALARRLTAAARSHVMLHHELRQVIGVWEGLLGQATL
jgi:hypothetical protein